MSEPRLSEEHLQALRFDAERALLKCRLGPDHDVSVEWCGGCGFTPSLLRVLDEIAVLRGQFAQVERERDEWQSLAIEPRGASWYRARADAAETRAHVEYARAQKAAEERDEWKRVLDAGRAYGTPSARGLLEAALTRAEQADAEVARLTAENTRLREALQAIEREIADENDNDRNALGSCIQVLGIVKAALATPTPEAPDPATPGEESPRAE